MAASDPGAGPLEQILAKMASTHRKDRAEHSDSAPDKKKSAKKRKVDNLDKTSSHKAKSAKSGLGQEASTAASVGIAPENQVQIQVQSTATSVDTASCANDSTQGQTQVQSADTIASEQQCFAIRGYYIYLN